MVMPKGPRGQKRPADVIGAAIMVGKIATGEIDEARRGAGEAKRGRFKSRPGYRYDVTLTV
jgi:hypothetical protein